MSTTRKATEPVISKEREQKIEKYVPLVDEILEEGGRLRDTGEEEYSEMNPGQKIQVLAEFYNREAGLKDGERYSFGEMLDYITEIIENPMPGAESSAGREATMETRAEYSTSSYLGEQELQQVVRELSTEEEDEWIEYIGIEETDGEHVPR